MANYDPTTKSTYASTDWSQYQQGRPVYPPSLTEVIYNYRRRHSGAGWDRLVDIGAGSGVAVTNFMPDFKIIHVSDPSPSNEEQARTFLPDWARRHNLDPEFEYSQATGEEAYLKTGENRADLVICATAAHFMDADGLVASIARVLRPGGTLAVYSYWMPSFPDQSQHFYDVFIETFDSLVLQPLLKSGDEAARQRLGKVIDRRMTGKGVLDSLPLPDDLFEDPVRVYVNADPDGEIPFSGLYRKRMAVNGKPLGGASRVGPRDELVHYYTGKDAAAEGWSFYADKTWLSYFFNSIRPPKTERDPEAEAKWERVFDEECPDGQVRMVWPAYLALATKKAS